MHPEAAEFLQNLLTNSAMYGVVVSLVYSAVKRLLPSFSGWLKEHGGQPTFAKILGIVLAGGGGWYFQDAGLIDILTTGYLAGYMGSDMRDALHKVILRKHTNGGVATK